MGLYAPIEPILIAADRSGLIGDRVCPFRKVRGVLSGCGAVDLARLRHRDKEDRGGGFRRAHFDAYVGFCDNHELEVIGETHAPEKAVCSPEVCQSLGLPLLARGEAPVFRGFDVVRRLGLSDHLARGVDDLIHRVFLRSSFCKAPRGGSSPSCGGDGASNRYPPGRDRGNKYLPRNKGRPWGFGRTF